MYLDIYNWTKVIVICVIYLCMYVYKYECCSSFLIQYQVDTYITVRSTSGRPYVSDVCADLSLRYVLLLIIFRFSWVNNTQTFRKHNCWAATTRRPRCTRPLNSPVIRSLTVFNQIWNIAIVIVYSTS